MFLIGRAAGNHQCRYDRDIPNWHYFRFAIGPQGPVLLSQSHLAISGRIQPTYLMPYGTTSGAHTSNFPRNEQAPFIIDNNSDMLEISDGSGTRYAPLNIRNNIVIGQTGQAAGNANGFKRTNQHIVPWDGVYHLNHFPSSPWNGGTSDGFFRTRVQAPDNNIVLRAGWLVEYGTRAYNAAASRWTSVFWSVVMQPNVIKQDDAYRVALGNQGDETILLDWANHGNWAGDTSLTYVRPLTDIERARTDGFVPQYIQSMR